MRKLTSQFTGIEALKGNQEVDQMIKVFQEEEIFGF